MDTHFLVDSMTRLQSASDLTGRWATLGAVLADHGFDQVNYALLKTLTQDRSTAAVTQFSTMDPGWIEHYLDCRLDLDDPHVRFVRDRGFKPYYFDETVASRLDDRESRVIQQAADAGLRAQISVVFSETVGSRAPAGGMTIGSSCDPIEFRARVAGHEQILMTLATLFHGMSAGEIRREEIGARQLSTRERDALSFMAQGLRVGRIAEQMAISEVTVELHLRNARRKLNAATTAQAVARGILLGDVTL